MGCQIHFLAGNLRVSTLSIAQEEALCRNHGRTLMAAIPQRSLFYLTSIIPWSLSRFIRPIPCPTFVDGPDSQRPCFSFMTQSVNREARTSCIRISFLGRLIRRIISASHSLFMADVSTWPCSTEVFALYATTSMPDYSRTSAALPATVHSLFLTSK